MLGHPAVADVCVVGIKDEYSGELPKAYIVLEAKVAESVKDDDAAIEQLKQVLKKARISLSIINPERSNTTTARLRPQSCIQATRGRHRIHRCYSQECFREIAAKSPARQG